MNLLSGSGLKIVLLLAAVFLASCSSGPGSAIGADATGSDALADAQSASSSISALHSSPAEMARTWEAAMVRVPDGQGGAVSTSVGALESGEFVLDGNYPAIIWMHGCSGFWSGTTYRLDWLASNGFVAIAPLSLARSYYPESCNLATRESGLYRPTLLMRQYDAGHAIEQIRNIAGIDTENVFLAGLSEGAAVATTYYNRSNATGLLKARIAESWGCHSGWSEFKGINAPPNEAVLALVADRDPWYTASYHQGDCGEYMSTTNGSVSIVVDYPPARFLHELWEQPELQEIILDFLLQQLQNG